MSAPLTAFPSFKDLKKNVAFEGGFSDGGVECISETLTTQGVDLAPRPGTSFGGFGLPAEDEVAPLQNLCALVMNFDTVNPCDVQVYNVFEDGSTFLLQTLSAVPPGTTVPLALSSTIVTHPNKLRLKLAPNGVNPLPTKRVLVKAVVLPYDKPADLDAE